MKMSKKLVTILCACLMVFSVTAGLVNVHNTANVTKAEQISAEEQANEIFKKKVRKYSTYSADVLDTYLAPIWNTDEVVDESCTIVGKTGSTQLLYKPVQGSVVIRDYHNQRYFVEGVDFTIDDTGMLTRVATGALPYFELDEYLSKTSLGFVQSGDGYTAYATNYNIGYNADSPSRLNDEALGNTTDFKFISYYNDGQRLLHHFNVSYRVSSKDTWAEEYDENRTNPVTNIKAACTPTSQADVYKSFLKKLQINNEATVMFYGDSITFGCDATGHTSGGNVNPYLPRWSELVCDWLGREYGANITYLNGAVGGWATTHGVKYWDEIHPTSEMGQREQSPQDYADDADLLVLGFGMNDATNDAIKEDDYKSNMQTMIDLYFEANPNGAVLLMSHMMPNTQSTYYGLWHQEVEEALYEVVNDAQNAGRAIAVAPVSSVFKTFEEKGKFTRNVLANNINHPTDFAIRVYAQTVLQTLTGYASTTTAGRDIVSDNQIIIGTGASVRLNTMALDNGMTDSFMAGIRYRGYISTEYFDDIGGNPNYMGDVKLNSRYKVGMWMVAEKVLTGTGLPFDHTLEENLQKNRPSAKPWVYDVPAKIWDDRKDDEQIDGYVRFNAVMLDIPNTEFGTDLVARVYLYDTQTDTYYVSRGMQNRNIAQVASMALAEETNFTPRQTQLLEWFIAGANNELANTFVYNKTTPTYDAPNAGIADDSSRVVLTRGDFLQFPITSSRLVPNVIVYNEAKSTWVPISQLYGDFVSFNADTGVLRVINNPKKYIEFDALVTLESVANLEANGKIDIQNFVNTTKTKRLRMVIFNSEFTMPANGYTFTTASSVQFPAPLAVDPSLNVFVYLPSAPAGTKITASTPNEAAYTNNVWTLTANSGNLLGKYTITVKTNSSWGGSHVIASKSFTINVLTEKQSSTSIVAPSRQQEKEFLGSGTDLKWYCPNCTQGDRVYSATEVTDGICPVGHGPLEDRSADMHDFLWYDDNEQAYHYQSINPMFENNIATSTDGIPDADVIRFNPNSSVMDAYNNNAANYQYVLIDVKFAYNNGTTIGGYTYDNTLAFWTLSPSNMESESSGVWWLSTARGTTVNIFDADDTTARRLTHADIVAGNWYTIAVPASLMIQNGEEVFALFGGHYENDAQRDFVATDLYFRNIRFENVLGADFSENQEKLQFATDGNVTDPTIRWVDTVYGTTGGAWEYSTATGINPKDYSYAKYGVMPDGWFLTAYNDNASQYKYLAIDIMYKNKNPSGTAPNIFFNNGSITVVDGPSSEDFYNSGKADGYIHRTYYADDLTKAYRSTTKAVNTWYTYIIRNPVAVTDYLFGIYDGPAEGPAPGPAAREVTVYFKNIRFLNELIDSPLSELTQSEADLPTDNQIMLSDMHVARNTTIESSADRTTYFQEGGYETNNEVPTPIKNTDATYTPNSDFDAPTQIWYTTGHIVHTSPQTIISREVSGANDCTVTQFRFTNNGYSYSDRILFNSPVHVSEISNITIRFYAVYPDYQTQYGGVRFFPYGKMDLSGFTGENTVDQGYMLATDIPQGEWTTVTFPAEYLADSDGFVRGFWIGQSANAQNTGDEQFIQSDAFTDDSAYMNIDCVTATKSADSYNASTGVVTEVTGATILSDLNTGTVQNAVSKADCTVMSDQSTGYPNANVAAQSIPGCWYTATASDATVIQFLYKDENAIVDTTYNAKYESFSPILFNTPIPASSVSTLYIRMYMGANDPNVTTKFLNGSTRFHAYGKRNSASYGADNSGWAVPMTSAGTTPLGWHTFAIDPSLLADSDGYIRGFWVSMNAGGNNENITNTSYINVDHISYVPKTTYSAETGYKFTSAKGWGTYTYNTTTITETERFTFSDAALSKIKTLMPSHKYITMDVRFEANMKNNLVFTQGIPGVSEVYYALQDGFNIDMHAVKRAYAYNKDEFGSAFKEPVEYKDMQTGVWYTVVIPIEYATYVTKDNYKLGVMTYAGTTEETAGCEAWLNNLQLKATADMVVIGYDGNDLHKLDRFVSPNDSYAEYVPELKAYKLNANGYLGLTDETKMSIGKMSSYGRMTIDIYFAERPKGNLAFWNGLGTGLGLKQEIKNNGEILAGATVDVYIAGTRTKVDYEDMCEETWYTVEILAPQEDWAFIGSFEQEVYFRNVILHAGDIGKR